MVCVVASAAADRGGFLPGKLERKIAIVKVTNEGIPTAIQYE